MPEFRPPGAPAALPPSHARIGFDKHKAPSPDRETVLFLSAVFYFFFAAAAACLARYFASSGLPRQSCSATGAQQAA